MKKPRSRRWLSSRLPLCTLPTLPTTTTDSLWARFLAKSGPFFETLAPYALTPEERRVLGGFLFAEGPALVNGVSDGLSFDQELFAQMPVQAAELQDEQDGALDLLFLANGLRQLAQLAQDAYLHKQSTAIRHALVVLERLHLEQVQPMPSGEERLQAARRATQLGPAQKLLTDRHKRKTRKTKQRQRALRDRF